MPEFFDQLIKQVQERKAQLEDQLRPLNDELAHLREMEQDIVRRARGAVSAGNETDTPQAVTKRASSRSRTATKKPSSGSTRRTKETRDAGDKRRSAAGSAASKAKADGASRTSSAPKRATAKKHSGRRSRKPGSSRMPRAERQRQVLDLAKRRPGISVTEAAKQLDLKESSLHTLASSMRREKLLAPSNSGSGLRPAK